MRTEAEVDLRIVKLRRKIAKAKTTEEEVKAVLTEGARIKALEEIKWAMGGNEP